MGWGGWGGGVIVFTQYFAIFFYVVLFGVYLPKIFPGILQHLCLLFVPPVFYTLHRVTGMQLKRKELLRRADSRRTSDRLYSQRSQWLVRQ